MKISVKLPLLIAFIGASALSLSTWIAQNYAEALVRESAKVRLGYISEARALDMTAALERMKTRFVSTLEDGPDGPGTVQSIELMTAALADMPVFADARELSDPMTGVELRIAPGEIDGNTPPLSFVGYSPLVGAVIEAQVDPMLFRGILADRADLRDTARLRIFAGVDPPPMPPDSLIGETVVTYMGQRFAFVATKPGADLVAPIAVFNASFLQQSSVALVFVLIVGLMLARTITAPLSRLSRAMDHVAQRQFGAEILDRERNDEVGELARQLDELRASLLDAANSARELAFKGACFDRTDAALMLTASDLTILYVNDTMQRFMRQHRMQLERYAPKFEPDAVIGRPLDMLFVGAHRMKGALQNECFFCEELLFGASHFRLECIAVHGDEEVPFGYLIRWQNVTELRREEGIRTALDALVPTAEFSADGRLLTANAPFRAWTGQRGATEVGRKWDDLFGDDTPLSTVIPDEGPFSLTATASPQRPCAVSLRSVAGVNGAHENFVLVALPDLALGGTDTAPKLAAAP